MIKWVCGLWGSPLFSVLFEMKVFLKNRILPHLKTQHEASSIRFLTEKRRRKKLRLPATTFLSTYLTIYW